jgi:SAM-dependent methyltransferase
MHAREDALGVTDQRSRAAVRVDRHRHRGRLWRRREFRSLSGYVTRVLAVEPEPYLRTHAQRAAGTAAVPVTVSDGTADRLPVPDGSTDAVVSSLVLCSVPDPEAAVTETVRVPRPDGVVHFLEHVRADDARLARAQQQFAPLHARLAGGCHPDRPTVDTLRQGGTNR